MPSWTDENGYDWFNKLECKRCLQRFDAVNGEVPEHDCLGGRFKSGPDPNGTTNHTPIYVGPLSSKPNIAKPKRARS